MKNTFLFFLLAFVFDSSFAQNQLQITNDTTYVVHRDSLTFLVKEFSYSDGRHHIYSSPLNVPEVVTNARGKHDFSARELYYQATSASDNTKALVNSMFHEDRSLRVMADTSILDANIQLHKAQVLGEYELQGIHEGTTLTISEIDNTLRWTQGNEGGEVKLLSSNVMMLIDYVGALHLTLYQFANDPTRWKNLDGLFEMAKP